MEEIEREFIELDIDGKIEEAELVCTIDSEKDDKKYAILTFDKEITEEINISVGVLKDDVIELIDNDEEYEYVISLMNKIERSEADV